MQSWASAQNRADCGGRGDARRLGGGSLGYLQERGGGHRCGVCGFFVPARRLLVAGMWEPGLAIWRELACNVFAKVIFFVTSDH